MSRPYRALAAVASGAAVVLATLTAGGPAAAGDGKPDPSRFTAHALAPSKSKACPGFRECRGLHDESRATSHDIMRTALSYRHIQTRRNSGRVGQARARTAHAEAKM
jgi:hypothetical protein